jgi:hypothetical protein
VGILKLNQPADLYNTPINYRTHLIPMCFKVGTHSTKTYLIRKKDLIYLQPGGQLRIYTERYDSGTTVLVDEVRCTGIGQVWFVERF